MTTQRRRLASLTALVLTVGLVPLGLDAHAGQVAHTVIVSDDPADNTPNIVDPPHAGFHVKQFAQVGSMVVVAGVFDEVRNAAGGPVFTTDGLFAFDVNTGLIDETGFGFPVVSGRLEAVVPAPDGTSVFVAGGFSNVDGVAQTNKVAKIDVATGEVVRAFDGKANKKINDLAVGGNTLYLGGTFTTVRDVPRAGIAAVDADTGALLSELDLPVAGTRKSGKAMHVDAIDVTPDDSRLVLVGNFKTVNSASREQIALVDLTSSPDSLANWSTTRYAPNCSTHFDTYIRDVEFSPDGSYFVPVTTGASAIIFGGTPTTGPLCDTTARWETSATGSNLQPTWADFTGGDTNYSVAVTGTAIYVGGHQRWQNNYWGRDSAGPGSISRPGIAALSPLNGMPFTWNPRRIRGLGAQALLGTPEGLLVGSDTDEIGGEFHAKVALMPVDGGMTPPPSEPGSLPGELYTVEQDGDMIARSYDGNTFGAADPRTSQSWSSLRGALMLSGTLYAGWSDGTFRKQTLTNGTNVGTQKTVNLRGLESQTNQSPNMATQLAGATGMFWDDATGRLYYTVSGDSRLYYRYFLNESDLWGDFRFTACGAPGGQSCGSFSPALVRGMTLIDGQLYFGQSTGILSRMAFNSSTGVPSGTPAAISGPAIDGNDWNSRGLFVRSDA